MERGRRINYTINKGLQKMKTIYISYGVDGLWYEWTDFKEMLEYYKGHPQDRWTWTIKK